MGTISYNYKMTKRAVSVTLSTDNLTWLRGRAGAGRARSLSDLLDQLVTLARSSGDMDMSRSVVGTIDFDASGAALTRNDRTIRDLFETSLVPVAARERSPRFEPGRHGKKSRGR